MITLIKRMISAIKLDEELYEEIPVNHAFLYQSIFIIILSSLCAGIATYPDSGAQGLILVTLISIFCWLLWGYLTFFITNMLLDTNEQSVDFMEMVRITGFASTPGIIRILGIIPGLFGIIFILTAIWMAVMMATAVKHAFDLDMLRSLSVSFLGCAVQGIILWLFL